MRKTALLLLVSAISAQEEPKAELPLKQLVLFTSGVGYFQRDGEVTGAAQLELQFDAKDVNDLLKSLVLRDFDGGQVSSVTYASRDPVTKTLKSFAIDLTGDPALAQILAQARGEQVEILAGAALRGTIVGVEMRQVPVKDGTVSKAFLNLLTPDGLSSLALDEVQRIRFLRPELDEELKLALATLAQGHDTQKKTVALKFSGEGKRRVRVAYIAESPVWKTSYRLVLGEGAPWLQGFAIVENTTDEDWKDVKLTLVSGRPISFIMDLYQPLYVVRPEMRLRLYESLTAKRYEEAMELMEEDAEAPAEGAMDKKDAGEMRRKSLRGGGGAPGAPAAEPQTGGFAAREMGSAAAGGEVGELFRYVIEAPVTLPRQKSALLPIVGAEILGEKVSIYDERVHGKYPLNGLKLRNTTALHLMQGPITVFDEGTYAGDALIDDLEPGGERLISYALDLDTEVEPVGKSSPAQLVSARLYKGTLITTNRLLREKVYNVRNRGTKAKRVLVEHPFEADWKLLKPEPGERTRDVYRFAADVKPGERAVIEVSEERQLAQQVALTNLREDAIEVYLRAPQVSDKVKEALGKVVQMKQALSQTGAEIQRGVQQVAEISQDQKRIRENMDRLDRTSQIYQRYVKSLTEQEDRLAAIQAKIAELRDQEATQRRALDEFLMSLDIS
ncbi:MAG TPA: hypothetical protein VFY93_04380 [Planctomycetota bacterium]|nr:hypothetical protein [Planctomycetota bacterium]